MSYIAFDLDALNVAPAVARSASVSEETVISGLVRMWAWCFREKLAHITADQLRGHFGTDLGPALVAFGFLEAEPSGWRVRGAERYLRVAESRSKGGKLASGNLKRGTSKPEASRGPIPDSLPAPAGEQPGNLPGSAPALTPSTEHRAPNTKEEKMAQGATPRESDALCQDFAAVVGVAYVWAGAKDGAALAALRKAASLDEVRTRWRRGLAEVGWLNVRTVAQLRSKWNDLAGPSKPINAKAPQSAPDWSQLSTLEVDL